ncbi:hypothetical protein [Catenovulum sediminis]|uniref:Uncharacterized protein n=1 Tax=Catenovulum sediminis TaxID=1740262 RepID=A0ABV1RHC9_9ALTE
MTKIYITTEVEVDLREIDTEDLVEELKRRENDALLHALHAAMALPEDATQYIERMKMFACSGNDNQLIQATNQFLYECIGVMPKHLS